MPVSNTDFDLGLVRDGGLTHVLDKGLGPRGWEDLLETAGDHIDIVKLGWGTSYVTANLERKLECAEGQAGRHAAAPSSRSSTPRTGSTTTSAGSRLSA